MSTLKRWLRPCRVGILFTCLLLLPGFLSGCPITAPQPPGPYIVPGVRGEVYPERQTSGDGRHYYGVREYPKDRVVYEGSREYELIEQFFRNLNNPVAAGDRSSIPGASGTLPVPAVQ